MFMLYALVIGLALGLALGGKLGRLGEIQFRWAPVAVLGFLAQIVLFSAPVTAVVGDLGPPLYVASTVLVLVVVARNVPAAPGLAIVLLGAASNLAAIVANGGYMPVTAEALAASGHATAAGYSNSALVARPAFEALVDRFVLPPGLPFANVFSLGDVLIGVGVVAVMVVAMRREASVTETRTSTPDGAAVLEASATSGRSS
jgi:hypothetical protein